VTGEATPDYHFTPAAMMRIGRFFPLARLIFILREPLDLSISISRYWAAMFPELYALHRNANRTAAMAGLLRHMASDAADIQRCEPRESNTYSLKRGHAGGKYPAHGLYDLPPASVLPPASACYFPTRVHPSNLIARVQFALQVRLLLRLIPPVEGGRGLGLVSFAEFIADPGRTVASVSAFLGLRREAEGVSVRNCNGPGGCRAPTNATISATTREDDPVLSAARRQSAPYFRGLLEQMCALASDDEARGRVSVVNTGWAQLLWELGARSDTRGCENWGRWR